MSENNMVAVNETTSVLDLRVRDWDSVFIMCIFGLTPSAKAVQLTTDGVGGGILVLFPSRSNGCTNLIDRLKKS
jgi:hypothetical protein